MKRLFQAIILVFTDSFQWLIYSSTISGSKVKNIERKLRLLIHSIEKGLCLAEVRLGFGKNKIIDLQKYIAQYEELETRKEYLLIQAKMIVNEYIDYHIAKGFEVDEFAKKYNILATEASDIAMPGIVEKRVFSFDELKNQTYGELISNRHSTRVFSGEKLDFEAVKAAVDMTRRTAPSACNRQSVKVYCVKDKSIMQQVLKMQGGNRGFGETAQGILVVTADMKMYAGIEKKLPLVDGGIFINGLANALFYNKVANCILHGCLGVRKEKHIKKICGISSYEMLVGFILVGAYTEKYYVAKSPRKPIGDTYKEI